ncbi:MAG: hypothetical protein GWP91_13990, partial [Rhodobacterales bacterium]|nr:hypothetical protein [Rhodobacterales bacterium]
LSRDQRVMYEEERQTQVVGVYVKASRYLDRGAQYAEITHWAGPEAEALNVGLKRIQQKVESLDTP